MLTDFLNNSHVPAWCVTVWVMAIIIIAGVGLFGSFHPYCSQKTYKRLTNVIYGCMWVVIAVAIFVFGRALALWLGLCG